MGTLFNQPKRKYQSISSDHLDSFIQDIASLSKKHGISVSDAIAAARVLELSRQNDLYVSNGDIFDEQIAGIGELLEKMSSAIEQLKADP